MGKYQSPLSQSPRPLIESEESFLPCSPGTIMELQSIEHKTYSIRSCTAPLPPLPPALYCFSQLISTTFTKHQWINTNYPDDLQQSFVPLLVPVEAVMRSTAYLDRRRKMTFTMHVEGVQRHDVEVAGSRHEAGN
jgi:hypothetical protein